MRLLILALIVLLGCVDSDKSPPSRSAIEIAGYLESNSLTEASGLARSHREEGLLWAINDDGPPVLYAFDSTGARKGKVKISRSINRDWEDLASFQLLDKSYLLIADIGDNDRKRKFVTIYVVEEPDANEGKTKIAWQIDYKYPDGPRDAEALAVDVENERVLVLSKRDIPAVLYDLPLRPDTKETITATWLGVIDSLPQPSKRDINNALVLKDWYWQPTAMDISADASSVLILTYRGVYYYGRNDGEPWPEALRRRPLGLSLGKIPNAEALAFAAANNAAFVTIEKQHAPLLRIDLSAVLASKQRTKKDKDN